MARYKYESQQAMYDRLYGGKSDGAPMLTVDDVARIDAERVLKRPESPVLQVYQEDYDVRPARINPPPAQEVPPIKAVPYQNDSEWYDNVARITGVITFFGSWAFCTVSYGFLFGFGLGWIPSMILAAIAGALWPLIALAIVVIVIATFRYL